MSPEDVPDLLSDEHQAMAVQSTLRVMDTLQEEILRIEKAAKAKGKLRDEFRVLLSIPGVGNTLGMTIMYETGDVGRFPKVGDYSSYCRLVRTERTSNGRKKGEGNRKNGNPYLSWPFSEAAIFAIRYQPRARRTLGARRGAGAYAASAGASASSSSSSGITTSGSKSALRSRLLSPGRSRSRRRR